MPAPAFRYRGLWLAIGHALIVATAWVSLDSTPPRWAFAAGDAALHAASYGVLAFWFGQIYPGPVRQLVLALVFVAFGAALEILQAEMTTVRRFEMGDLAANAAGVGVAWILLRTGAGAWLQRFDRRLAWRG